MTQSNKPVEIDPFEDAIDRVIRGTRKTQPEFDCRRHAARLSTGQAGGTPLANLSRSARNQLKRPAQLNAITRADIVKPTQGRKEMLRRQKQMQRQAAKAAKHEL